VRRRSIGEPRTSSELLSARWLRPEEARKRADILSHEQPHAPHTGRSFERGTGRRGRSARTRGAAHDRHAGRASGRAGPAGALRGPRIQVPFRVLHEAPPALRPRGLPPDHGGPHGPALPGAPRAPGHGRRAPHGREAPGTASQPREPPRAVRGRPAPHFEGGGAPRCAGGSAAGRARDHTADAGAEAGCRVRRARGRAGGELRRADSPALAGPTTRREAPGSRALRVPVHRGCDVPGQVRPGPGAPGATRRAGRPRGRVRPGPRPARREVGEAEERGDRSAAGEDRERRTATGRAGRGVGVPAHPGGREARSARAGWRAVRLCRARRTAVHVALRARVPPLPGVRVGRTGDGREPCASVPPPQRVRGRAVLRAMARGVRSGRGDAALWVTAGGRPSPTRFKPSSRAGRGPPSREWSETQSSRAQFPVSSRSAQLRTL
jgi:hypothetical protein